MPLSPQDLIAKLQDAGVQFEVHEHAAVMTVDAQEEALAGVEGKVVKNLFIKDKKHRLYIISALSSTKVDLQVLSARLGTGKGGLRMAPAEMLDEVLKVPQGSVTPLAVSNPEASGVVLLLDANIKTETSVFVHPLVNTISLRLSGEALGAALKAVGQEPVFVDLEAEPKIDRENPPDLAAYAANAATFKPADENGAAPAAPAGGKAAPAAAQPAAASGKAAAAPAAPVAAAAGGKGGKKGGKEGAAANSSAPPSQDEVLARVTDVHARTEELLHKVSQALTGKCLSEVGASGAVDPYVLARLRADVESVLTGFKNAAYATGYKAGKGEVVAYAQRQYA